LKVEGSVSDERQSGLLDARSLDGNVEGCISADSGECDSNLDEEGDIDFGGDCTGDDTSRVGTGGGGGEHDVE
jgi:hypothetical protein